MLKEITLSFFILNIVFLGALALSYSFAALRMKSKIIYSLALLFTIQAISEMVWATSFKLSHPIAITSKCLSAMAAAIFLIYSFKKQKVLKRELYG